MREWEGAGEGEQGVRVEGGACGGERTTLEPVSLGWRRTTAGCIHTGGGCGFFSSQFVGTLPEICYHTEQFSGIFSSILQEVRVNCVVFAHKQTNHLTPHLR